MSLLPSHPHLARLHTALTREQEAESDALAAALALPLDDQIAAGVRWPTLTIERVELAWRGPTLVLRARSSLHGGIREGEPVDVIFDGTKAHGRVLQTDTWPPTAVVELRARRDTPVEPQPGQAVQVVRRLDPTSWQRYRQALWAADSHPSPLRSALLNADFAAIPESVRPVDGLDSAQTAAMAAALSDHPLAVVHGPPGTGKTWLLGRMLRHTVDAGKKPWALAESNAAVDHLAATARSRGLDVVRLGHPARVHPSLQDATVDARLARGPLAAAVKALQRDLVRCQGRDRAARADRRRLRRQLQDLRQQAWDHAVSSAEVIACTFGTLARVRDRLPPAPVAFVDEATQATEPAVWVAVPRVDRLVLVGDPEQLGPVVKDPGNPLEDSALQRIVAADPDRCPPMLEVQHRMSTAVQALVGPTYGPRYRAASANADARLCDLPGVHATDLTRRSHLWIDTAGTGAEEVRDPISRSLGNAGEVRLVGHIVEQLRQAGVEAKDIGVITPYSAQVAALRNTPTLTGVDIGSVNAFQGRERPVIVVSWVRSNEDGALGFVTDERRLTVAWSRAKYLLVQVGDLGTLGSSRRFTDAADQLADDVVSAWEPPFADVLALM